MYVFSHMRGHKRPATDTVSRSLPRDGDPADKMAWRHVNLGISRVGWKICLENKCRTRAGSCWGLQAVIGRCGFSACIPGAIM